MTITRRITAGLAALAVFCCIVGAPNAYAGTSTGHKLLRHRAVQAETASLPQAVRIAETVVATARTVPDMTTAEKQFVHSASPLISCGCESARLVFVKSAELIAGG